MRNKHLFTIILLLFYSKLLYGQISDFPFDKECFILGLVANPWTEDEQFFSTWAPDSITGQLFDFLFSSSRIDDYYEYEPGRNPALRSDTIYALPRIKKEKLQTPEQKLSYLAGVFFRFGQVTYASGYFFSNPGSSDLCIDFLQDLDCKDLREDVFPQSIPGAQLIYFTPSEKVREMIKQVEKLGKKDVIPLEELQMMHARSFLYAGISRDRSGNEERANANYIAAIPLCDQWLETHPEDYQVLRMRAMLTLLTEGMKTGIEAHEKLLEKPLKDDELEDIRKFINHFKNRNRNEVIKSIIYE
jgi:hypothetical protein